MRVYSTVRGAITALLVVGIAGVLGYTAYRYVKSRDRAVCPACVREIHPHSRTVAAAGGGTIQYCCPACALRQRSQSGNPLRIVELTNHPDGTPLEPADAAVVVGSDVNPCLSHEPAVGQDSQPMNLSFDRCEPSILAFATRDGAESFARVHGGRVMTFRALSAEFR